MTADGPASPCGKLPLGLLTCPVCVRPDEIIAGDFSEIESLRKGNRSVGRDGLGIITRKMSRPFSGNLIEIRAQGLLPVVVTPEHPVLVVSVSYGHGGRQKYSVQKWKSASEVLIKRSNAPGDCLVLPNVNPSVSYKTLSLLKFTTLKGSRCVRGRKATGRGGSLSIRLDEDFAWLLGVYVAEGFSAPKGVSFCTGHHEKGFREKIVSIGIKLGYSPCVVWRRTSAVVEIPSRILARAFLEWCGHKASGKVVPDFVLFHKDEKILRAFVDGYEQGDGYYSVGKGTPSIRSSTVSRKLALSFQLLCGRLGEFVRIYKHNRAGFSFIEGRKVRVRDSYSMIRKTLGERSITKSCVRDGCFLAAVRSVKTVPYTGKVFNISTSDETFLVSNAITHNCSSGLKPCRGWTWINSTALMAMQECKSPDCGRCPLAQGIGRCGLLWIGMKAYPTAANWLKEARFQGISRRIKCVPKDFVLGKTWILVAHRKGIKNPDGSWSPAVFSAFVPKRIEKIVTGEEQDDEIDDLVERGITPVFVKRRKATFAELDNEDYE